MNSGKHALFHTLYVRVSNRSKLPFQLPRFATFCPVSSAYAPHIPCGSMAYKKYFYHCGFSSFIALVCRVLRRFARVVFFRKIVKNITVSAKRGKMRRIEAVKRSQNVVKGGCFTTLDILKMLLSGLPYLQTAVFIFTFWSIFFKQCHCHNLFSIRHFGPKDYFQFFQYIFIYF